jgi:pyruvate dehydrogenase E1 component beta subunit
MTHTLTFAKALEEATAEEMRRDQRVFHMGIQAPPALVQEFGKARVRRTPISEAGVTGMAVGAAGCGFRPIVNWSRVTFAFVAFDQVVNHASKIRYMFGGQRDFPMVLRAPYGGGHRSAAQHSQSPYSLWAHLAGLKVILPSGAADAKGLMKTAIRDNNPVVSFEAVQLEGIAEDVPEGEHLVPFGVASVKREGMDVTVVALGYMVRLALQAAEDLAGEGISVEVVDPRTIVPLDLGTIRASVRKTGRLVVVDEAPPTCSMASEIATIVVEDQATFRALRGPVQRVCALSVPVPFSPPLEDFALPDKHRIAAAVRAVMAQSNGSR